MNDEIKSFKDLPPPAKVIPVKEAIRIYQPRPKERVVNSELIKWKPVDIVAARVASKAAWYCKPPDEKPANPKLMNTENALVNRNTEDVAVNKKITSANADSSGRLRTKTVLNDKGSRETLIYGESVDKAAAVDAIKAAPRTLDASEQLVERAEEASDTLRILIRNIGPGWDEFEEVMKKGIAHARQTRIGMEIETRQLMASLREVRQFFLDEQHEKEIARLREFVSLCHQLKELKDSGFLDAIADTMLALTER